jgi:hypothetical protein
MAVLCGNLQWYFQPFVLQLNVLIRPSNKSCLNIHLSVCLSAFLPVCLSVCLSVYLLVCLLVCLSACLPVFLSACLSVFSVFLSDSLSVHMAIHVSVCLPIYPTICLSVHPCICPSVCLSIRLFDFCVTQSKSIFFSLIRFQKELNTLVSQVAKLAKSASTGTGQLTFANFWPKAAKSLATI